MVEANIKEDQVLIRIIHKNDTDEIILKKTDTIKTLFDKAIGLFYNEYVS